MTATSAMDDNGQATSRGSNLRELAWLFPKLGTIGFGGPAAHIALMEHEVVRRRAWLTREEFLDLVGAANLIPGPNSTELAIHIGRRRAGLPGLIVAGVCFILPAFFIVIALGWAYQRYGRMPEAGAMLRGIKPVMVVIVIQALWMLARSAIKSVPLALAGVVATIVAVMGLVDEIALLAIAAIGAALIAWLHGRRRKHDGAVLMSVAPVALWPLFLVFAKAGSLLFGSGYVLLAFLQTDLVERFGWLTRAQLLDAIVAGQVSPGPVFTTATFIGYQLAGFAGAVVATAGIFAPAFVFVALSAPLVPRMRQSRIAGAVLDAVNVASLALMAAVTLLLAQDAIDDIVTVVMASIAALLLLRYRVEPTILIVAGGLIGVFLPHF